ncbi:hypothetical protein GCM10027414_04980 [Humibacter ginsengiterrae]
MTSSTTTVLPDDTEQARELIHIGLAMDPGARSETLARLIAATIHDGPGTALETFAATGKLNAQAALEELNDVRVPVEQEDWVTALGRFILTTGGRS